LLVVSGLSFRYRLFGAEEFMWLLGAVAVVALAALLIGLKGFADVWRQGRDGARPLALAGILLAFAVTPFASFAIGFIRAPTLSDVATDPADPPVFQGEAAPLHPEQLEDAPAIVAAFPELGGRSYRAAPEQVVDAVETLMRSRGWDPIARFGRPDDGGVQVEGVATTLLLRFEMDVAARIADDGDSTFVDVRSASRFGRHDMGANAELIRRFLADLDAEMLARLGT
ncbi:MAG: DUF1499 domain-containing protein, partial [Rhizobiaceae bacterium]